MFPSPVRAYRRVREALRSHHEQVELVSRKRKAQETAARFSHPYKLHLACGNVRLDGWINIDLDNASEAADISWDLSKGIPFADSSCEFIYCEHFLEHLDVKDGVAFLKECRRVLQPDGVFRLAMPSLDMIIEKSYRGDWQDQDWLTWPEYQFVRTRAEMLNIAFRWWGHRWLYDRDELHRRMHEAGFEDIVDAEWSGSRHDALRNLETRKDSLLICEAGKS